MADKQKLGRNIPPGKCCNDCYFFKRCAWRYDLTGSEETCCRRHAQFLQRSTDAVVYRATFK